MTPIRQWSTVPQHLLRPRLSCKEKWAVLPDNKLSYLKQRSFGKAKLFQTVLYSTEEETLLHICPFSMHIMYVYIGISMYKHSIRVFRKITGMHISGHTCMHPDWGLCTFVFIEWA